MKNNSDLIRTSKKYTIGTIFLSLAVVAVVVVSCSPIGSPSSSRRGRAPIFDRTERVAPAASDTPSTISTGAPVLPQGNLPDSISVAAVDSLAAALADSTLAGRIDPLSGIVDSLAPPLSDTIGLADWVIPGTDTAIVAAGPRKRDKPFLESPVTGKAQDSVIYSLRGRTLDHYNKGELVYQDNDLKADYIRVFAATKNIFGTGQLDTAGVMSRPEFVQAGTNYTMDTVTFNLDSRKALIDGVATRDGEGWMLGGRTKMMPDKTSYIEQVRYTTCDRVDHPHFYIAMTKAKVVPGKKIITGPAYFVMEDVPVYFLGVPGGFFPMSVGPTAGIVMPTWGEEGNRGFYLRGGGYYFTFGDYLDLRLTADLYTLGSWGVQAASRYIKRYKYSGTFGATYNKFKMDDESSNQFNLTWNHTQDPKANPGQNFSANVNFSTAGQKQLATTSLQDHLNTSSTSSISYSRNWNVGQTTVNMTAQFNMTTNSRDSSITATLPNVSLSVGSFAPFKRKTMQGKQRWYEKITMDYAMQAQNSTAKVKESEIFTKKTLQEMQNGINHRVGVKTSLSMLRNAINFSPSFNYQESWNFKRQMRGWDPNGGSGQGGPMSTTDPSRPDYIPPEFGFYRTYGWSVSGSFSTKLYGMFEVKRKPGQTGWLQAIRHMVTPSLSFSYSPDFRHPRYGFYEYVQSDVNGGITGYIPVQGSPKVSPGGPSASVTASLSNQLEIKVKDRRDSTMKKVTIIEQLAFNGISWNFLLDSMNMGSGINISLRTGEIFKGFALQLSGQWDPYMYIDNGSGGTKRVGKFNIGGGKFGRITSTSWSFGKTFNSPKSAAPAAGSINGAFVNPYDPYNFSNNLDPATRRLYMVQGYYDFTVPWTFTFNYNVNYRYSGLRPEITQNLGFNGSVTLTEKWGFNFNSGYDFTRRKISHMQLSLQRDLHCWEMSFQWVPMGMTKMYAFHIGIKAGMLADIKYDKQSNAYDNLVR